MKNSNELPRRGRGRPCAFDRAVALHEAMLLFWRKGYEATSIAELTAAMGIEAPSLYAAFGSKKDLFKASLQHYGERFDSFVWENFRAAPTARAAIRAYLIDSTAALTGAVPGGPRGCMVTLSAITEDDSLSELVRAGRAGAIERLRVRIAEAVTTGEIPASVDVPGLARFVQTVQSGMSIMARDGAERSQLATVAEAAMLGWDGFVTSKA